MKKKKNYESPTTQVVELQTERVLCNSGVLSVLQVLGSEFAVPFAGGEDW